MHTLEADSLQTNAKTNHAHSQADNINIRIKMKQEIKNLLFLNRNTAQYLDAVNGLIK